MNKINCEAVEYMLEKIANLVGIAILFAICAWVVVETTNSI